MNFKAFTGGGGDSGTSFAAVKALFEAAKKPENRALATAAAKNPVIRNAAISAAQNPTTRNAMISAASTYGANQNAPSSSVLRPEPAPAPPVKDYSSSSSGYGSAPTRPAPAPTAAKPIYPDLMSELKSLNIGCRDEDLAPPAPSFAPSQPGWKQPSYQPAPPPQPQHATQRQEWTKFNDAPARPPLPKNMPLSPKSSSPTSEAYAVVKFPHNGSHFDELTCVPGDRIVLKREVDEQWIYGLNQRTGKFGIVPIAFLDVRVPLTPTPTSQKKSFPQGSMASSGGVHMATALYDYFSQESGDLSFSSGAKIIVVERVGTEWLNGEINGRRGIFPSSFVDCPSLSSVPLQVPPPAVPSPGYSRPTETLSAIYDYNSGVEGDLVFFNGDSIEVVERMADGEWVRGRVRGVVGLAPLTYLSPSSSSAPSHSTSSHSLGSAEPSRFPPGTACDPPATVTAIADHHTTENDCLYFSRGDQILIIEYIDNEWAKGKLAEFKKLPAGYFQRSYVQ